MPGEDKPPPNIKRPTIVDPHDVQTTFVDWIVSVGVVEGVLNISLGTVDYSMRRNNDELPRVVIGSRLRMTAGHAKRVHEAIGNALGLPNPEASKAPKNKMN